MKLYEINEAMETLLSALTVDPETGEVPVEADEIINKLDELSMEKQSVLEFLAKTVLNVRSDVDSIDAEIKRLNGRKDALKKREQSLMNVLDRECDGQKTDLGVATLSYRSSEATEIADEKTAIEYLQSHGYKDAVTVTDPVFKLDKIKVKTLIKGGVDIPGCSVIRKNNVSLK